MLEQILARDDAPTSATTQLRELSDPAVRLHQAVQRYTDGLHVAAEHIIGPRTVEALDHQADQVVPGVTDEPAWPTLRADLIALAAETGQHPLIHLHQAALGRDLSTAAETGQHPIQHLHQAADGRELNTAADLAAVLDWRLPPPAPTTPRPLPWLPGIPQAINDNPEWGPYLAQRTQLIALLANDIRQHASRDTIQAAGAAPGAQLSVDLIGDIAVWRAANGVNPHDRRPTGPAQPRTTQSLWQQALDRQVQQQSNPTFDVHAQASDAAGRTTAGLRPEGRRASLPPYEVHRESPQPGPSR